MKKYIMPLMILTMIFISGCSENKEIPAADTAVRETAIGIPVQEPDAAFEETTDNKTAVKTEETKQPEQNDLIIPISDISDTAKFYTVNVDGTDIEVFAVKDSGGNIKTAFNTCQSCYTSGNGRYELEGKELVCQNCGFHFTADDVGNGQNGGCSPWAVGDNEKTLTDDSIIIPYDFLAKSKNIFAKWN